MRVSENLDKGVSQRFARAFWNLKRWIWRALRAWTIFLAPGPSVVKRGRFWEETVKRHHYTGWCEKPVQCAHPRECFWGGWVRFRNGENESDIAHFFACDLRRGLGKILSSSNIEGQDRSRLRRSVVGYALGWYGRTPDEGHDKKAQQVRSEGWNRVSGFLCSCG